MGSASEIAKALDLTRFGVHIRGEPTTLQRAEAQQPLRVPRRVPLRVPLWVRVALRALGLGFRV